MRKKHYILIGFVLVVLIGIGYFLFDNYLNTNKVKDYIQSQLPDNIELNYSTLKTNLFLGNLTMQDVRINVKDKGIKIDVSQFQIKGLDYSALLTSDTVEINLSAINNAHVYIDKSKADSSITSNKKNKKNIILKLNQLDVDFERVEVRDTHGRLNAEMSATNFALENLLIQTHPSKLDDHLQYDLVSITTENLNLPLSTVQQLRIGNLVLKDSIFQLYDSHLILKDKGIDVNFDLLELRGSDLGQNFVNDTIDFESCTLTNGKVQIDNSKKQIQSTKDSLQQANKMIRIKKLNVRESDFNFLDKRGKHLLKFDKTHANFADLKILTAPENNESSLTYEFIDLNANHINFALSDLHTLTADEIEVDDKHIAIKQLEINPIYDRLTFQKHISTERDVIQLSMPQLIAYNYDYSFDEQDNYFAANKVAFIRPELNIYRNKATPDNKKRIPLYSEMLRNLDFGIAVDQVKISDGKLIYEEHLPGKSEPGKLFFEHLTADISNFYNQNYKKELVQLAIDAKFMGYAPMHVDWRFHIFHPADQFTISGVITDLNASSLDGFLVPNLKATIDGKLNKTTFDFTGNDQGLQGTMDMVYDDLDVELLNNKKEKKGFWSTLANFFIKNNKNSKEESKTVQVERVQTKSFFNLFWLGLKEGLKSNVLKFKKNTKK